MVRAAGWRSPCRWPAVVRAGVRLVPHLDPL